MRKQKRGFTLVELLAVIVIIGILFVIAVPAVSSYIDSSRKDTYVTTAHRYINGVKQMIASKKISIRKTDTTYYIPFECVATEYQGSSPYGDWKRAYVAVTYGNEEYNYYWTSTDESNRGILLSHTSKLNGDRIKNNIIDVGTNIGVGGREKILVINSEKCTVKDAETFSPTKNIDEKDKYDGGSEIISGSKSMSMSVSPNGWATSKTVTINFPEGYVNEYSIDFGKTWKRYTGPVVMTENGTIIGRISDGAYYVKSSSQTITGIDNTISTLSTFETTVTSKSITITATGEDKESGIGAYSFSKDDGKTWTTPQTSGTYTFTNLKTGTYKIKVRVINGTYKNNGVNNNYLDSKTQDVTTKEIKTPTYEVNMTGWSQSKKVTITYPSGYTNEYSTDGGSTWKPYTGPVTFNANGTIMARVNDGVNYVTGLSYSVTNIENTKPTLKVSTENSSYKTSGNITLTASDTGGSNLSSNTYEYCLSTSNTSVTGCTWTAYTSGTAFTISGTNQTKYLWVYPVKDNAGNINGSYTNTTTPYLIGTYKFDSNPPTLSITSSISGSTATIKLTAADTGGSNLSSSNTYKYCLSTSSTSVTGCTWTAYTSGTQFTATGTSGTGYLWVYPVKDNSGNVNDGKTFGTAYMIKSFSFDTKGPTCSVSVSQNNHPSGVSFTWSCTDDSGISGTASATVSNRTSNWSTVVKDKIGNQTTITVNIGTKTQYRYRNCSAQNCSNITEIQEHCQPSVGPDCVYGGYSTTCKNQYGNSMKYYCGIEVVIGQTCSGCKTWGSWSAYGDTAYSASSTRQVETRTVYYRK